jgi:hypothetical protein
VTPVERVGIAVEDAAFLAVEVAIDGAGSGRTLTFRTNVGDIVAAGPDHAVRFEAEQGTGGLKPYLNVRGRLEALVTRSLALDLVALGDEKAGRAGIWSGGAFFPFSGTALG